MKAIKLYAWEEPYQRRIQEIRDAELVQVKRMAIISIYNSIIFLGGATPKGLHETLICRLSRSRRSAQAGGDAIVSSQALDESVRF